ncbi:MAG: phosphoribosyltransferase family protein [Bacteroidota bacterium]
MKGANLFYDLFAVFFPRTCAACETTLLKHERVICSYCEFNLPRTGFHLEEENAVSAAFWGRAIINRAAAFYYFNKGNKVQTMIHKLKYKGRKDVGMRIGEIYGKELAKAPSFSSADLIIPVPLHPKRQRKRGYNQSECFANGLALSMNAKVNTTALIRTVASQTQTKKSRMSRWDNVSEIFEVKRPEELAGKNILLVDDVMTTGATLEACAMRILTVPGTKICIATIACAIK